MSVKAKILSYIIIAFASLLIVFVIVSFFLISHSNLYQQIVLLFICTLLFAIVVYFVFNHYIYVPIQKIIQTISTDSPEKLIRTGLRRDEFGKIARFIMEFFNQRNIIRDKLLELNKAYDQMEELNHELYAQKQSLQDLADRILLANEEISLQKSAIEEQNSEITQSIDYASIIQSAVLAVPTAFKNKFQEHFIFFQPRNVLSGDFYWIQEHNGLIYVVGADCTGHSLAGALLSMMGISFLNNILVGSNRVSASDMLNNLRVKMIDALHQRGEFGEAHGGMDIVLCIIDTQHHQAEYAGAYNPLYIGRFNKDVNEYQIIEMKGDSMPVGVHLNEKPFTSKMVDLVNGDMIYISTDGFRDQFGGAANKKFNARNFKNLLVECAGLKAEEQMELLRYNFLNWKGTTEQTDDILVMGIRYN